MKVLTQYTLATAAVLLLTQSALFASTNNGEETAAVDAAILNAASESAVYISESGRNLPAPPPVQAYEAAPVINGFGDDLSRVGISFPLSFD